MVFIMKVKSCWFGLAGERLEEKGRTETSPARKRRTFRIALENKLGAELDRARSSRPHGRIGSGHIRRRAAASEGLHRRIVQAESVLSAVRIGEVRMIEDVEELSAELEAIPFPKMKVLGEREIKVAETGVREHVPAHISELPERRRKHNRGALGVASKERKRLG